MSDNETRRPLDSGVDEGDARPTPEEYVAPRLRVLGDVRSLTLGGISGVGDSMSPGTQQP